MKEHWTRFKIDPRKDVCVECKDKKGLTYYWIKKGKKK